MRLPFSLTLLFSGLLLANLTAFSQQDTLTLQEAINLAVKNNGNIKISELGIRQGESRTRELAGTRYPLLSFHSHYLHTPELGYDEVVTNGGEYAVQIATRLQVYDGGIRSALIDQSAAQEERARVGLQKSQQDIAFNVRALYYDSQQAQEEIRINQETAGRLADYQSLLQRLRLGGIATESDVLKAQVELNNARINVDRAQQNFQKAILSLRNVTGLPLDGALTVTAPPPSPDTSALPLFLIEQNPDFQLLEREKNSAAYDVSIARAERLPTLTVAGDAGALGVSPKNFRNDIGYSVLLSLELPIFDWGPISRRIEQKELAQEQIDREIELQRRELETEWRITLQDLDASKRNLQHYGNNIGEAERNYLAAKSRFLGGAGSNLEVLDAQRLLSEVKLNYNAAYFQIQRDLASALRLSGHQ